MALTNEFDRGYGPSVDEFESYTNRTITNIGEFYRQRARAQEVLDAVAGPWPPFHFPREREVSLDTVTSTAVTTSDLNSDKSGYYNFMRMRVVDGNGRGFVGYVDDYDGTTKELTISGVQGDFALVNTSSQVLFDQIATFPREHDIDIDNRPVYPEVLSKVVAYIIEYWTNLEAQDGFNADELANQQVDITQESLGDWQTTYSEKRSILRQMIGPKAFELGIRAGLFNRSARLVRFGPPTNKDPNARRLR
jgi:hypothetical protein